MLNWLVIKWRLSGWVSFHVAIVTHFSRFRDQLMLISFHLMWWGQMGDTVHEGDLAHEEVLQSLLDNPGMQVDELPPVTVGLMGHKPLLDGLEVVPHHPGVSGVQEALGFISQVEVVSQCHGTWWSLGPVIGLV